MTELVTIEAARRFAIRRSTLVVYDEDEVLGDHMNHTGEEIKDALRKEIRDAYLAGFADATAQNAALVAKTIAEHAGPERRTGSRSVP